MVLPVYVGETEAMAFKVKEPAAIVPAVAVFLKIWGTSVLLI